MHWQYGKSTYYCTFPLTCPWKKFINPRPKNDQWETDPFDNIFDINVINIAGQEIHLDFDKIDDFEFGDFEDSSGENGATVKEKGHTSAPNVANVSSVKLNSVDTENIIDIRPRAYEKTSKKWILVDTGAMVSVWPKADYPDAKKDNKTALEAVNKTKIATYGRIERKLNLSEGNFVHMVYIADVPAPVLGLDFLFKYKQKTLFSKI